MKFVQKPKEVRTSFTYDTSEELPLPQLDNKDEQSQPSTDYDYYDDYSPRQADLGLLENKVPKCGERSFTPLQNRERNQASPGEFPWMCLVLGKDEFGGWDKAGYSYDVQA